MRISSFGRLKTITDYYSRVLEGYMCVGIERDSETYEKAVQILNQNNNILLTDNPLLKGYVRVAVPNRDAIAELSVNRTAKNNL